MEPERYCVLGAGVVGLSVALRIAQSRPGSAITVVAERHQMDTTSSGAGGLWEPYQVGSTPEDKITRWGGIAYSYFMDLFMSPDAGRAGVNLMPAYALCEEHESAEHPSWASVVAGMRSLTGTELRQMKIPSEYTKGYTFTTMAVDMAYYMKYLQQQLIDLNVHFETHKVLSLDELTGSGQYDAVINCSGLGAKDLLRDDSMRPVRGQVLRVRAPWIKAFWMFGDHYIIPNSDNVVLGGTKQVGDWNLEASEEDTKFILDGVSALFPSLRDAPIEKIFVGLRPVRDEVRLECGEVLVASGSSSSISTEGSGGGASVVVAHCYGHGGCGITLGMGCAEDLVVNHLLPLMDSRKIKSAV